MIVLVVELAARVQAREDQLDARQLLLRMDIDGHPAAVVRYLERAVGVEHDVDLLRVTRQRLVDAVVDDLVREVIRPRRVGVHPGTTANGLEPAQDFDVLSAVVVAH